MSAVHNMDCHCFGLRRAVVTCCSPPPASGLSDEYSNGADITFASFLGARSYQPGLNPKEDPVALMSLKRRDDSGGNSDGSGPPSPPLLSPEDIQEVIDKFFKDSDLTSANISSTIDKVGDGAVNFYKDGDKAGKEIGVPCWANAGKIS
ncbi:hypothetical protein BASA50_001397 [Batrachochytrium salamandrivorans]|uniref:Uncharacterized protein n=1 Tax=Batrachochytrium salamandrivorans TaxID=1357716 RepID=A0ABQ8EVG1_9FUNG|nr:hypothetical protein BASA50_001397 [Batrachochytrium salamandrivorans]